LLSARSEALPDHEIARRATRGAASYVFRSFGSQAIQAVSALVVARILDPREYGVFALAMTLVGAVRVIGDLGITYSLSVRPKISDQDLRVGVTVALLVALIGTGAIFVIWDHLSLVRHAGPDARWIGPALAVILLIAVPQFPSLIVMERELRFARAGMIAFVAAIPLFVTQVVLLLAGAGLWSMVIAQIVGTTVGMVLIVRASGRFYLPAINRSIWRLVHDGFPYQGSLILTTVAGTVATGVVAAMLGAHGLGLYAWCTILATPVIGALTAVHSVSAPTLARMRRDDGARYEESVEVITRTLAVIAAIAAGCLIGLANPTIRYIFGERWLPATGAVQFCLAGTIATAILNVLAADANAKMMRRTTLIAAVIGGLAILATLWPLIELDGVAGASAAYFCIGPIVSTAVFAYALRTRIADTAFRAMRLFVPLLALSIVLGRLAHTPAEFALVCAGSGIAGAAAGYFGEGELFRRIVRMLRLRDAPSGVEAPSAMEPSTGVVA
jgi:PST family polysaccharide transporter